MHYYYITTHSSLDYKRTKVLQYLKQNNIINSYKEYHHNPCDITNLTIVESSYTQDDLLKQLVNYFNSDNISVEVVKPPKEANNA